jgi:hypothetical protein
VALDVSVLFVFVDAEGCFEAAALGLPAPKSPSFFRDSAARESEVTVPVPSWMGLRVDSGSVVTYRVTLAGLLDMDVGAELRYGVHVLLTRDQC